MSQKRCGRRGAHARFILIAETTKHAFPIQWNVTVMFNVQMPQMRKTASLVPGHLDTHPGQNQNNCLIILNANIDIQTDLSVPSHVMVEMISAGILKMRKTVRASPPLFY